MGEILVRREGKKMEHDNNKMTGLTCGKTCRPDNTACLDYGENAKNFWNNTEDAWRYGQ